MPAMKEPEPRRHHYVPQCWLAGFTDTGEKDGQLWVTGLVRRKQWQASPRKTGRIRAFSRLADKELDPVMVEKAFANIEAEVAPILRILEREQRRPVWKNLVLYCPLLHFSGRGSLHFAQSS